MASNSNVKDLPPGDPKLTASIVSHLKSRGLFDQLRRDCLGDVDTKPAYLNLKQRIEGYITKFLATQTWTPDMNKNHVRDTMRREINESGMLSAGMDHLVDQIVNPKIYHVFTPEVEKGVRQYLGLSCTKDSASHQFAPATDAAADAASQQAPRTPFLPPPAKSEFSIDETTQDVPGSSFSPEEYAEAVSLEELTDSSCEPQLMIVTESNERTEETAPPELKPKKIGSRRRTSSDSVELVPAEVAAEPPSPQPKLQVASWSSVAGKGPCAPLDKGKPDFLKSGTRPVEKKEVGKTAEVAKKDVKPVNKDKKERKLDSGKSKEHSSHLSKSESHSKDPTSKKMSSDANRSKTHKHKSDGDSARDAKHKSDGDAARDAKHKSDGDSVRDAKPKSDGDSARDAKHSSKEKDKRSQHREKSSSRDETSRSRADSTKDERSKGSSHHSSRPKESDGHSDRKRSDDKHRSHHSSSRHDDKKRHGDKHSREEKPRDHHSDGHRSHSESRKDKDKSSTRDSSRHHKSSKSTDKHSDHSKRDRSHEKEKHSHTRRNSSDSKDGATSKTIAPHKSVISVSQDSFLTSDDTSSHLKLPETSGEDFPEVHTDSHDVSQQGFQGSSQDGSLQTVEDSSQEASQTTSSSNAHHDETKLAEKVTDKVSHETPPEMDSECSRSTVQLVEEKEAEILRFSYVTDEMHGNSEADLQLVSSIPEKAELEQKEAPDLNEGVKFVNGDEVSGSNVAGPLGGEPEQKSPLQHKGDSPKTDAEQRSAEKRRQRCREADGNVSEGAWSDVTVSSVHTSDLSSYDDRISVSSGDETGDQTLTEKKKIPLKDIKKMTSSSNEDDDRMSKSETEPNASDAVVASTVDLEQAVEHAPAGVEGSQPVCLEVNQSQSSGEVVVNAASSPPTVAAEGVREQKMGLRRTRKINPKYVSEEFSSIFTEGKRPAGTIDFSELAKYGKEKHHEEQYAVRAEPRKTPAREDALQDFGLATSSDTEQLSDASVPEHSRRPSRRPSGSESRHRSESTSSKRYESSDLYKPRPIIKSGTRRSRPLPATLDEEEEEEDEEEMTEDYEEEPSEPLPKRHRGLKVCIGFKRGRASTVSKRRKL